MSEEWKLYVEDPRQICKYGAKCYQKNPQHHNQFKHPPASQKAGKNVRNRGNRRYQPYQARRDQDQNSPVAQTEDTNVTEPEAQPLQTINKNSDDKTVITINLPEDITYHDVSMDQQQLKELFLVEMPADFFEFYKCLEKEDESIEKILSDVNLQLIGPYELLLGQLPKFDDKELYLVHWRFFFDPPEFQAVLKTKGNSEFHMGYFRDSPDEMPAFVAGNDSSKNCIITPMSENIFGAVYNYLQNEKKKSPFTAMYCQRLSDKVKKWAADTNNSIEDYNMKNRLSKTVTKTFHSAGIVVPYNKKTQLGYRKLAESDNSIKKMFKSLEEATTDYQKDKILSDLQPVITYANIAVDECDFGTGLEAGINLFCSGLKVLEPSALSSLTAAYSLLNRDAFSKIIQAHLKYRRKGPNMSVLSKSV